MPISSCYQLNSLFEIANRIVLILIDLETPVLDATNRDLSPLKSISPLKRNSSFPVRPTDSQGQFLTQN